jgi:8-oxo-dGTP pyrophosphatase MutT (NUDIX family)
MKQINKVGLLCIEDGKLLVVYKGNIGLCITPGGKIEPSESDEQCLEREVQEELGCNVRNVEYFDTFRNDSLVQRCYLGDIDGSVQINPHDTIDNYCWIGRDYQETPVAPMLRDQIIPALIKRGLM